MFCPRRVLVFIRYSQIRLHLRHHIRWQVVEYQFAVGVEEVLAVEHQHIHAFAVDGYLAALLQLHSGQLFYQCVEHRAFGQFECVGIICQCVSVHIELHLRCRHHHLVEHYLTLLWQSFESHIFQFAIILVLMKPFYLKWDISHLIFRSLVLYKIVAHRVDFYVIFSAYPLVFPHHLAFHLRTVASEQ